MKVNMAPPVPLNTKGPFWLGTLSILIGLGGFLVWSLVAQIDSAVVAQGKVQVHSQNKQVQHFEGGIVTRIHVQEDQRVKANDVLITLDETFAGAEHQRLMMQGYELSIREAVLFAERDVSPAVVFPVIPETYVDQGWIESKKAAALQLFELKRKNLGSELLIHDKRLEQMKEQVGGLLAEQQSKQEQLGFMEDEIRSWKKMVERKLANKLRYLEVQGDAAELKGRLNKIRAQIAEVEVKIGEVELERLQSRQLYQEAAANELRDIQYSIKDLNERLEQTENILGRIAIKAPVDGKVTGLKLHTIGAVVKPGDTLMEIVPEEDKLIVETQIQPTDVDQVYSGLMARIRLSAFQRHELPELQGLVESISADAFQDPQTKASYYLARISLEGLVKESGIESLDELSDSVQIQPGMPAEVMVVTGNATPAQYLVDPLLNAFNRAWRDG